MAGRDADESVKVLFWSETFWPRVGGVERLAARLLPALRDRGHDFLVVTWVAADEMDGPSLDGIEVRRFPFFAVPGHAGALRTLEHLEEIRRLKRAFAPDLVHVNSCGRSAWFHLAATPIAAPTLVTLHQPLPLAPDDGDNVATRLLANASWIACCSHAVRATVRDRFPDLAMRSGVINNALPVDPEPPPPWPSVAPRLLFAGRLVPEKGLDAVLDALVPLFARFPEIVLDVAGEGPLRPRLEAQVRALGLASRVRFAGAIAPDALRAHMAEASVVLVPSRVEGFGLVALEAALMGRPVVAMRVGGLSEVVQDNVTGILVDPGDGPAFTRAVARLLSEPDAARRLGVAARARALVEFAWDPHVRAYDDLYRRLAA